MAIFLTKTHKLICACVQIKSWHRVAPLSHMHTQEHTHNRCFPHHLLETVAFLFFFWPSPLQFLRKYLQRIYRFTTLPVINNPFATLSAACGFLRWKSLLVCSINLQKSGTLGDRCFEALPIPSRLINF
jgi:hypothetical protein